jgi:hypothetical protein
VEYCDSVELAETCINFSKDTYKQSLCFRNAKNIEYAKACRAMTADDFRASNCLSLAKSVEHIRACADYDKDPVILDQCMSQIDDAKQVLKCKERAGHLDANEKLNCLTIVRYEVDNPEAQPK